MQTSSILILILSLLRCSLYLEAVDGGDTLAVNQSLSSKNTLVSGGGNFELGFFSPGSSLKEYIGVWYKQFEQKTVIWVANRESPVVKTPGTLTLREDGVLEISDHEKVIIWSSNTTYESVVNPVAQLQDSGNFVVRGDNQNATGPFAWQGFDHPCNTRVPGMKIGYDVRKKRSVYLSSWKSLDDPAEGEYLFKLDITGIPQYFYKKGSQDLFRFGPWNGQSFSGTPDTKPDTFYTLSYTSNDEWIYFDLEPIEDPRLSRTVLGVNGSWLLLIGNGDNLVKNLTRDWVTQKCDGYNWCGPYASCDTNKSPVCECLTGYVPKFQRDWDINNWTKGCVRITNCSRGDKFAKLSNVKVPDTRIAFGNITWSLKECMMACSENCSCTAYGNYYWDVKTEGTGCLLWFGELNDIRVDHEDGQDIYIRGDDPDEGSDAKVKVIMILSSIISALVLIAVVLLIICHRKRKASKKPHNGGDSDEILEITLFDLETMSRATNNFSVENKLGEGGFGPVYRGMLQGGQAIAVKKLSQNSKQGSIEFKNEVMCIAKLQHRNLVKLIGCCNQEEYMLVYEFMPNKSLDLFIFDEKERATLDWSKRLNIIGGIARGLLYLHQDSQLIVIHRDLKASNVLLDCDMNPKISDFGMARICGGSDATVNTTRVVGTYGYMSPEYAREGRYSVKSDVFSFGVMILEIISGRRNRGFNHPDHHLNLLGHIWELFRQERFLEAMEETLTQSYDTTEVIRAIHIGLLCVQERPRDRPDMASVVLMLSCDSRLPLPKPPGFFTMMKSVESGSSSSSHHLCSPNQMSVTLMTAR